jgi:NADPH-dependent curcumin reductase CurA
MAAWRPDDLEWEERMQARISERHRKHLVARDSRLEAVKRELAAMGNGSPLFGALREQYMQADPAFRARMERLSKEDAP